MLCKMLVGILENNGERMRMLCNSKRNFGISMFLYFIATHHIFFLCLYTFGSCHIIKSNFQKKKSWVKE
jgi:hypothetical protein